MFFYLCRVLFSGFLQFKGNFVDGQNNSKYRDWAPLSITWSFLWETLCVCHGQCLSTLYVAMRHQKHCTDGIHVFLQVQVFNLVPTAISQTSPFLISFLSLAPFSSLRNIIWTFKVFRGGISLNFFRTSPAQSWKRKNYKSSALQKDRYWLLFMLNFLRSIKKF